MTQDHSETHTIEDFKHELEEHDEWFRHDSSEQHQESHGETSGVKIIAFLGVTVALVFGSAIVVLQYFNASIRSQQHAKQELRTDAAYTGEVRNARAAWEADLDTAGWVDADNGVVRLPADVAMDLVIEEANAR